MIKEAKDITVNLGETAPVVDLKQLNTLTLERNSVLIARVPRDGWYEVSTLQTLYQSLKAAFPNHTVFVWYDDVDFMAIHDKSYAGPSLEGINDISNYY